MVRAMRFLHTSDWHLGRSLHKADLREAQERFLDDLVETARQERVDAVLIAGRVRRCTPEASMSALLNPRRRAESWFCLLYTSPSPRDTR